MAKQYFSFKSFLVQLYNFAKLACRLFDRNTRGYLVGLFCLFCVVGNASATISKENKLKAAYLLNFTKFIKWPTEGEKKSLTSIKICVEESAEFIAFLSEMAVNPIFNNREYEVKSLIWDTTSVELIKCSYCWICTWICIVQCCHYGPVVLGFDPI